METVQLPTGRFVVVCPLIVESRVSNATHVASSRATVWSFFVKTFLIVKCQSYNGPIYSCVEYTGHELKRNAYRYKKAARYRAWRKIARFFAFQQIERLVCLRYSLSSHLAYRKRYVLGVLAMDFCERAGVVRDFTKNLSTSWLRGRSDKGKRNGSIRSTYRC